MQSLIHGNFEGAAQKKTYALVGAAAAIAAEEVQQEILSINDDARDRALQVALLVPVLGGLLGLFNSFRMRRLADIEPVARAEGMDWA